MKTNRNTIKDIIKEKSIYSVYQPIVSLNTGNIYGYEALTRILKQEKYDINIEDMFCAAEKYKMIWELEKIARKRLFGEQNKNL